MKIHETPKRCRSLSTGTDRPRQGKTDLLDYLLSYESGVLKREGANYRHR